MTPSDASFELQLVVLAHLFCVTLLEPSDSNERRYPKLKDHFSQCFHFTGVEAEAQRTRVSQSLLAWGELLPPDSSPHPVPPIQPLLCQRGKVKWFSRGGDFGNVWGYCGASQVGGGDMVATIECIEARNAAGCLPHCHASQPPLPLPFLPTPSPCIEQPHSQEPLAPPPTSGNSARWINYGIIMVEMYSQIDCLQCDSALIG